MRAFGIAALVLPVVVAGCGGTSLKCGEGTFKSGGQCVPYDPNDTSAPVTTADPPGGRTRDPIPALVTLTANEPATIFYTTDGSEPGPDGSSETSPVTITNIEQGTTLKFYAVDAAGNQEATVTTVFDSDTRGPSRLSDFSMAVAGSAVTLTWTNPSDADFAGVAVARVLDLMDAFPEPGSVPAAPAVLSSSVQLVYSGTGATHGETVAPGFVRFVAWPYDDLGNHGSPTGAWADVALFSTSGTVRFDVAGSTTTTLQQPTHLTFTGSSTYNLGTVTLQLTVDNQTTKFFENPKIALMTLSTGLLASSDGTLDGGEPFQSYGPDLLAPGVAVTRTWTVNGVGPTAQVDFGFALASHPTLYGQERVAQNPSALRLADSGSALLPPPLSANRKGPNNRGGFTSIWATPDGRFLFGGTSHSLVERFDLLSRSFSIGAAAGGAQPKAIVSSLIGDGSGRIFAIVKNNGHRQGGSMSVVEYDEGLRELRRTLLADLLMERGNSQAALSPDGRILAVAGSGQIALLDTETLEEIDVEASTANLDRISLATNNRLRSLAFAGDGTLVAVERYSYTHRVLFGNGIGNGYQAEIVLNNGSRANHVTRAPDGRVWIATDNMMRIYDPQTDSVVANSFPGGARGIWFVGNTPYALLSNRTQISELDSTGAIVRTSNAGGTLTMHWLTGSR